ncbi:MAG TPA: hypothetical protein VFS37_11420 [Conexibacter sp.]|nr:hypothetical protein [Conexibacter sp.]
MDSSGLIFRVAVIAVTFGGCVPTFLEIEEPRWAAPALIAALGLLVAIVVWHEIRVWLRERPARFRDDVKIRRFMQRWIAREGRVTIYTRDMSWANDEQQTLELLTEKARRNELCICLPRQIEITRRLEQQGATVHTYEALERAPTARFTIIRHGRQDAQVAIGRSVDDVHTISTYSLGHDPAFGIASDLIEFLTRFDTYERDNGRR